jgi:energy-coupling factor transport system ATP-binding protein
VRFEGVTYGYPAGEGPALEGVDLTIAEGAFELVAGPSAGGKSTLLRLVNGLVPQFHGGRLAGRVAVCGMDPARTPTRQMATIAGMVFQEPEAQAITDSVEDEIAFGMEQHGVSPTEMRRRIAGLLPALGIEHLRFRALNTLSGGERQRVAIAAVLALEPRILLLDEPTSQIDPAGADAVIQAVMRMRSRGNLTVLIAEHRLERILPIVDGVVRVERGRVQALAPRDAARLTHGAPPVCQLGRRLGVEPLPLSVEEARAAMAGRKLSVAPLPAGKAPGGELVRLDGVTVAYGEQVALVEASLTVREGEIVALVGANGSGKTTLFRAIAGLEPTARGAVQLCGRPAPASVQQRTAFAGLVPQDPAIALYHETVEGEVAETLRNRGQGRSAGETKLSEWGIGELAWRNPRDVSVGQQQRVAVAAMLAHEPRVWMLDEPTRGADFAAKGWLAERFAAHAARGGAVIVATHDIESAARYATRVIGLEGGRVAFDLPARRAFGTDGPLPTQVARLVLGAIVAEEVVA